MNEASSAELQTVLAGNSSRIGLELQTRLKTEKERRSLTEARLAESLFEQIGLHKLEALGVVDSFFNRIRIDHERGETLNLSGFRYFSQCNKAQRRGRNPKEQWSMLIAARRVATFDASQTSKREADLRKFFTTGDTDASDIGVRKQSTWHDIFPETPLRIA